MNEFYVRFKFQTVQPVLSRRRYEAPKTMAAPLRTNQVNEAIRHPRTTFGAVIVNVNN